MSQSQDSAAISSILPPETFNDLMALADTQIEPYPAQNNDIQVLVHPPFSPSTPTTYSDRIRLQSDIQAFARANGFAIATHRSKSTKVNGNMMVYRVVWACKMGPFYSSFVKNGKRYMVEGNSAVSSQKKTSSFKMNCPWEVHGCISDFDTLTWTFETIDNSHNHASFSPHSFPEHRLKIPFLAREFLQSQFESYVTNKEIISTLCREYPGVILSPKDITNLRSRWAANQRKGLTEGESLLQLLHSNDQAIYCPFISDQGRLLALFLSTQLSMSLSKRFDTIFILDCTYKTNRYKLPLLHIVGRTSTHKTFTAALALMGGETQEWYTMMLELFRTKILTNNHLPQVMVTDQEIALMSAIKTVFPAAKNLLCNWHINKNLVAKGKGGQSNKEWADFMQDWRSMIVNSPTHDDYLLGLVNFKEKYLRPSQAHFKRAYDYAMSLQHLSNHFIRFATDNHRHLVHVDSSRVEGGHKTLKGYLNGSTGDLCYLVARLLEFQQQQYDNVMVATDQERARSLCNMPKVLSMCRFIISHQGLKLAWAQYRLAVDRLNPQTRHLLEDNPIYGGLNVVSTSDTCTGQFSQIYGIPCSHRIQELMGSNLMVTPNEFSKDWWLADRSELDKLIANQSTDGQGLQEDPNTADFIGILNPEVNVSVRGRPVGKAVVQPRVQAPTIDAEPMINLDTRSAANTLSLGYVDQSMARRSTPRIRLRSARIDKKI